MGETDSLAGEVTNIKDMENCENDFILEAALENDETDSFYEADSASVGASSSVTDDSSLGSISQLGLRRGSACRQLHPFPTIQQVDQIMSDQNKTKQYVKKANLTDDEILYNKELFENIIANEFPEEDMIEKSFRDKDKDLALKSWILKVLDENEKSKQKEKKLAETEELSFFLQSGIVLCRLAHKIVPNTGIQLASLQAGNLMTKRKNISLFLQAAGGYGVPDQLLFKPDDLAVQAHFYKVTRTLFAFAEMTNMDPDYAGPEFDFDQIIKDLMMKGIRRKSSIQDTSSVQTNINSIFATLMQDVERRNSLTPKGPPQNIYACD